MPQPAPAASCHHCPPADGAAMTRIVTAMVQLWTFLNYSEPVPSMPVKCALHYYGRSK